MNGVKDISVESVGEIDVEPTIEMLLPLLGKYLKQQKEELKQTDEQASSPLPTVEQGSERCQYRSAAS